MTLNKLVAIIAVLGVMSALAFLVREAYTLGLLYMVLIYVILAESWNILGGYAGQICLGIGAFFGVGSYAAMMLTHNGVPAPICILAGGVVAVFLGVAVIPALKLRGVYFAIGTLFLPEIVKVIVLNLKETGGAKGLLPPLGLFVSRAHLYISSLVMAVLVVAVAYRITNSRIGLAFRAIREDDEAAECCGVNPLRFKVLALLISAFIAGIAGGLHAYYVPYLEPYSAFNILWSISPVFMSIIGGAGTISGPVIGAGIFAFLRFWLLPILGEIDLIVMGSALIVVVMLMPEGVAGIIKRGVKVLF
ncbi:MAG: branched-chain amino acid ABC transporter permease [Nitrososphaerota archaeon]|nr:branched-chain amino acid ABC transporter permease [Candidatus Bathyarchaeota archaeon]MDW8024007.1 branched-chain amino acid ABC transporter permease [Nitrososphaerota archaeon]